MTRALILGTIVAVTGALVLGVIRTWIWVIALEPVALGVVIGEVAAVPSTARHRRPPRWTYACVAGIALASYLLVHIVFWLTRSGFPPSASLMAFLQAAPSATATPVFREVDLARQIALASGGLTQLKYWIWAFEAVLMAAAATFAYRGGSVRKLKL